jgi:hypothetical protein
MVMTTADAASAPVTEMSAVRRAAHFMSAEYVTQSIEVTTEGE